MNSRFGAPALALGLALLLGACATHQGSVVLLPDPAAKATALAVTQGDKTLLLDHPYAAAELTSRGPKAGVSSAAQVQATFGGALAALPAPPAHFTLYFVPGKDEFTDASKAVIDQVFGEIARRPVPDVLVVGHTDAVGGDPANDALSLQRAQVVKAALVARGLAPERIAVVGRGKREPVVATAGGVAEPRNRRVEILVR